MLLLSMIFFAGVLHGLGPDHLAAITAFGAVAGRSFRRITFFSIRFAAGHAVVLAAAALVAHFGRTALPLSWERRFDLAAAGLLLLTGIVLLVALAMGKVSIHAHAHEHPGGVHEHFHAHFHGKEEHGHRHGKLAFALGGLFALGGARSLLVIVPVAVAGTAFVSFLRIATFTIGIAASMVAYGLAASSVLGKTSEAIGNQRLFFRLSTAAVALFCIIAGLITLGERLS
jgi:ABC-type nickel/cobalt efflux system permease component RcnA